MSIPFFPYTFIFGMVMLLIALYLMRRAGHGWLHLFGFTLFWLYAMLILSRALFPIPVVEMDAASAREQIMHVFTSINWILFTYSPYTQGRAIFREVLLNFLITIPAGLLLPYLFKLQKRGVWIALLISGFGIELLQLALEIAVKVPYRVVDISDVILNSSGFLAGFVLYQLIKKGFLLIQRAIRIN